MSLITMNQLNKEEISLLVKQGRIAKGYTQQQVSDLAGISLRSVQRIENGDVLPRMYTLKVLAENLEFTDALNLEKILPATQDHVVEVIQERINKPRQIILSTSIGLSLILAVAAFLSQSATFPETSFELFVFLLIVSLIYATLLFKIWK